MNSDPAGHRAGRPARIWRRLRHPLAIQHRLVYRFDLSRPVPAVNPTVPVAFTMTPVGPPEAREAVFTGTVSGAEGYRMRIAQRPEDIAGLVPFRPVREGDVFFYDCHTAEQQRGRNIYPAALTEALRRFQGEGGQDRSAYIRVRSDNRPSVRGIEKAGFRLCGWVRHVTVLGISLRPYGQARSAPEEDR